tara:strand:+ start:259 stop:444 length:186 start_codon:yes stop_codon:yes gene_type:complete
MMSTYDAFVIASKLAIEVHTDEQAEKAIELARVLSLDLTPQEVHDGKKEALDEPIPNWLLQ